jgi:AraC-like DNA-binding protein
MAAPQKVDSFGCSLNKLGGDFSITTGNLSFHRKLSREAALGRIALDASDRGFLIGLSRKGGHKRRIFNENKAADHVFDENSIYVRNLDEDYRADVDGSFDFFLLEISTPDLEHIAFNSDMKNVRGLSRTIAKSDPVLGGLTGALFAIAQNPIGRGLMVEQISAAIGIHLLHTYGDGASLASAARLFLSAKQEALAKDYLVSCLPGEPTIDEAACMCGLSRSTFIAAFQATTGLSPHRWLMNHRIGKAKLLLSSSALHLRDIAYASGFASVTDFTEIFIEENGVTPLIFRLSTRS